MLALPGSAYLYQGEELGLPEATELPDEVRQDPTWERSKHTNRGRDGCRVPFPWEGGAPSYGFGPSDKAWLPQPEVYGELAVDRQTGQPGSTLELYRELLRLRREHGIGLGTLSWVAPGPGVPDHALAFDITSPQGVVRVLTNVGGETLPLPEGAEVLVSSVGTDEELSGGLPTDATVWLRSAP
jgi:alpha-glucosidase